MRRKKVGRPKLFQGDQQLLHIRLPTRLMEQIDEARDLLEKPSLAEVIREALREYVRSREKELRKAREQRSMEK
jgi:metal-responsive CopG/Arc/MetJ family transcriptional regulator